MTPVTIEISEETRTALEIKARLQGCSIEALVQEAVEQIANVRASADPTLVADIHRLAADLPPIEMPLIPEIPDQAWEDDPFWRLHEIGEEGTGSGLDDIASQHDHYIYGTPKHEQL